MIGRLLGGDEARNKDSELLEPQVVVCGLPRTEPVDEEDDREDTAPTPFLPGPRFLSLLAAQRPSPEAPDDSWPPP